MSLRVCLDCPALTDKARCPEHRRTRERQRGSATARGYGRDHQQQRADLAPLVATGNVKCWRCSEYIKADTAWDLGHDDDDRGKYKGPEHVACNRATSGRQRYITR